MKIQVVKKMVENNTVEELKAAEVALIEDRPIAIKVDGDDEGERLTHLIAAIWILGKIRNEDMEFNTALRQYTVTVRESAR